MQKLEVGTRVRVARTLPEHAGYLGRAGTVVKAVLTDAEPTDSMIRFDGGGFGIFHGDQLQPIARVALAS